MGQSVGSRSTYKNPPEVAAANGRRHSISTLPNKTDAGDEHSIANETTTATTTIAKMTTSEAMRATTACPTMMCTTSNLQAKATEQNKRGRQTMVVRENGRAMTMATTTTMEMDMMVMMKLAKRMMVMTMVMMMVIWR